MIKITHAINFIIKSIVLGIIFAFAIFAFFPELKQNNKLWQAIFTPQPPSIQPVSYAMAVKRAAPAVVNIYTQGFQAGNGFVNTTKKEVRRLGSGVIASEKGFILTAQHVVKDAEIIEVALQDGRIFAAQLIGSDTANDLAVLYVEADNLPVIPINPNRLIQAGDLVLAIGNPYNLGQTITQGIVSATGRSGLASGRTINLDYSDFIQMDAAINDGNSGGALVNSLGELVGINSAKLADKLRQNTQGIFFAVNAHSALKIMQRIITDGRVVRSYLGISGTNAPLAPELQKVKNAIAIYVRAVSANSPAALAGIQAGDLLIDIAGQPIINPADTLDTIEQTKPGTEIKIIVLRKNIILEKQVIITELPQ
jgi:serine protease DegS